MIVSFSKLVSALGRAPNGIEPSTSIFPRIASDSIQKQLGVRQEAERRGKNNLPPSDQEGMDQIEAKIVGAVRTVRREGIDTYNREMRAYASRMSGLDIEGSTSATVRTLDAAITELRERVTVALNYLYVERNNLEELKREVGSFRAKHKLERVGCDRNRVLAGGVLFFVIAAETIMNAVFFMQASELGYAGGAVMAFAVSFINIAFCFLLGRFSTYAIHRSAFLKLGGFLIVLLFLCYAAALNLYVGHFREAAGLYEWTEATQMAGTLFAERLYRLGSFESWVLAGLGVIASIVGFIDGVKWDDPYPGFGDLWRRWREAMEEYAGQVEDHVVELRERRDRALDEINKFQQQLGAQVQNYIQSTQFRGAVQAGLPSFLDETEEAARALLSTYREVNQQARTTDAPMHFDDHFVFEKEETVSEQEEPFARDELKQLLKDAGDQLSAKSGELMEEYQTSFEKFRSIPDVILAGDDHGSSTITT